MLLVALGIDYSIFVMTPHVSEIEISGTHGVLEGFSVGQ